MMELEPWDALDVDDSDLSTFLRPCKRRSNSDSSSSSSSCSLIPGPAGAVQAAMMQRSCDDPLPTQEFLRRAVQNGHESDRDFNSNPWLCALQFVRTLGAVDGDDVAYGTSLSSIKKHSNAERVAQIVAVVKSCTPNGFGDMMVTLKDPSSTASASVHRKVFTEGEFGKDITVGSVVVLRKVAVFSPTRSTCYLNITLHNIVKVFSKDSEPPSQDSQQIYPARSVISTTPSITQGHEKLWMPESTFHLPQERTDAIMSNLMVDSRFRQENSGQERGESLVLTSCHYDDGNRKTVLDRENSSLSQDNGRPVEVTSSGALESEMEDQDNPPQLNKGDSLAWIAQGNSSATNLFHTSHGQETGVKKNLERHKQIVNPRSSIPHWTDDQLDELLAFD